MQSWIQDLLGTDTRKVYETSKMICDIFYATKEKPKGKNATRNESLYAAHLNGTTQTELAKTHGISVQRVHQIINKFRYPEGK